ncbi:hypothetical protein J4437_08105, partial [Candidatus Woesearchaeota archaeon]|nr:hypothetical protein [Candidatus Woesearchaeota archaeon]
TQLLPYMIVWMYKIINLFYSSNIEFAAVIFPVIMFALTIISFFLFVREIFIKKNKENKTQANIIALISTFFMIVIPAFLSRTIAGIPEKESAAFFFMFFAFYLFLKAWKTEKLGNYIILGILAGVSTALMGLIWGGVMYIFIPIGLAGLIAFIINKFNKKEFIVYSLWMFSSFALLNIFSNRYSVIGTLTSLDTGLDFFVFSISLVHFILWNTSLSKIKPIAETRIPKNIFSLLISIILLIIAVSLLLGPSFIIEKIKTIHQTIFKPVIGRWKITVAENRQPNFKEWSSSFGPFIKNIPVLFWLFFTGSIVLFKKMVAEAGKRDSWILTGFYSLFLCGLIFSRYSGSSIFSGENFISKSFYYISALLLVSVLVYYYIKYEKEGKKVFENMNYGFILLFSLFIFTLFTARGAVRLIMVLGPIAPIFVGYLVVESFEGFRKNKEETLKILLGILFILIIILSIFTFWKFYQAVKSEAYNFVPSMYTYQWQKAMEWIREETPKDAVFGHWWDYGYWLQTIGKRATMLDGGNAIGYWNYLMGRYVLTGDNQKDALEVLYNHNVTHFIIDSTDIGKYTAFSSIGSDINFDRYSWFGTFLLDERQIQETKNQTLYLYTGGAALDEDLIINEEFGQQVLLPGQSAGIGAIIFPIPYVIAVFQGRQYKVNLRYLSLSGKEFFDFKTGIEAVAYIFPKIIQEGQGINSNPIGAAMFISPRLFRGMLSNIYILNDPLKKFPNFELAYSEPNWIVDDLNRQGMNLPEFIFFQGVQGPIKIWEVKYTGNETIQEKYIDKDSSKYIGWQL